MSLSEKRYPLAPLMAAGGVPSMNALRQIIPMGGSTYQRVQKEGLHFDQADRWACKLGFLPGAIWPEWWDDLIEAESIECADENCGRSFVPKRKGHRYCTERCGKRAADRVAKRRRYAEDPEFAAAERERVRTYREGALPAVRVKDALRRERTREEKRLYMKAYYAANRERLLEKQRERDRAKRAAA